MKFTLEIFDEIPSTSERLLALKNDPAFHGHVIAARKQTAGVGRRGRTWHTANGNLAMSVGLKLQTRQSNLLPWLPIWMSVSTYEVVNDLLATSTMQSKNNSMLTLKWPNDIYLNKKKLAGILSQARVHGDEINVAIGLGMNLVEHPDNMDAISLAAVGVPNNTLGLEFVLEKMIHSMEQNFSLLHDLDELKVRWEKLALFLGSQIFYGSLEKKEEMRAALAMGLDHSAQLLVRDEKTQEIIALNSEDMSLRF